LNRYHSQPSERHAYPWAIHASGNLNMHATCKNQLASNCGRSSVTTRIGTCGWLVSVVALLMVAFGTSLLAQEEAQNDPPSQAVASNSTPVPTKPTDGVMPIDRAWEYAHYRVRVWLCTDGSPEVNGLLEHVKREIVSHAETVDRSAWELLVDEAPNPWNWRFSRDLEKVELYSTELATLPSLLFDDKLMVVSLKRSMTGIFCDVREFDIATRQWGSRVTRNVDQIEDISQSAFRLITTAFMPIALIDYATPDNEVILHTRAVLSCVTSRLDENGEWIAEINESSPVYIQERDVFLPVLRRTDRDGKLTSLEPVPFTFITLDKIEEARIDGFVQSTVRAPLAARKSKRLQKYALVIRPPESSTTIQIFDRDAATMPMEGIEVYSRRPNQPKEEKSELLGKTDWRGMIEIPPSPDGLRMIYLSRGARALRKFPIVPGFIPLQQTDVANDEARLFAEGVIAGVNIELIDLLTQRLIYEEDMNKAMDAGNYAEVKFILEKYTSLPRPLQIRTRLTDEKARLSTRAKDANEQKFINGMFDSLLLVLSNFIGDSKESEILRRIDQASIAKENEQNSIE
jgi:hypothetical protein